MSLKNPLLHRLNKPKIKSLKLINQLKRNKHQMKDRQKHRINNKRGRSGRDKINNEKRLRKTIKDKHKYLKIKRSGQIYLKPLKLPIKSLTFRTNLALTIFKC